MSENYKPSRSNNLATKRYVDKKVSSSDGGVFYINVDEQSNGSTTKFIVSGNDVEKILKGNVAVIAFPTLAGNNPNDLAYYTITNKTSDEGVYLYSSCLLYEGEPAISELTVDSEQLVVFAMEFDKDENGDYVNVNEK